MVGMQCVCVCVCTRRCAKLDGPNIASQVYTNMQQLACTCTHMYMCTPAPHAPHVGGDYQVEHHYGHDTPPALDVHQ